MKEITVQRIIGQLLTLSKSVNMHGSDLSAHLNKDTPNPLIIGIVTPDQEKPAKTVGTPHPKAKISHPNLVASTSWTASRKKRLYTEEQTAVRNLL